MGKLFLLNIMLLALCVQQYLHAAPAVKTKITSQALSYMINYGYYKQPDASLGQIAREEDISMALKEMQRFAGIPVSGIMDDPTKQLLNTPRCGMRDVSKNLVNAKRKRRYTLQGTQWQKEKLTWKLLNDNDDGLTRAQVESVLEQAFSKWQAITNLKFTKLEGTDPNESDIQVSFVRYYHNDQYPFDGPGGTLAHAYYPLNNQGLSGDVHFDDDEVYTINSPSGRSLLWVAVHEIGHSIGLEHSNIKEAVMYPWYRGNGGKDFDLHEDDRIGIQTIYGSRAVDPEKPVTGPTTTTTVAPGVTLPPIPRCIDSFKAVFLHPASQKTYIMNGDKVYILGKLLGLEKGPFEVKSIFSDTKTVDAAYVKNNGNIVVFSGKMFHIYSDVGGRVIESGTIASKYKINVDKIDAAFIWNGNGRMYLFSGEYYYRFDENKQSMDYGYPKRIERNWKDLPSNVDAVFIWRNLITYFFKDNKFYRFDNDAIAVAKDYPRGMEVWTKCDTSRLQGEGNDNSSSVSNIASTFFTTIMILVVKFLQ